MTPDQAPLKALADRLSKAEGGESWQSAALDCDIHALLVAQIPKGYVRGSASGRYIMAHASRGRTWSEKVPAYTTSLDAAVALVEAQVPDVFWLVGRGKTRADEPPFGAQLLFGTDEILGEGEGPTAAIALVLALLKALETQHDPS